MRSPQKRTLLLKLLIAFVILKLFIWVGTYCLSPFFLLYKDQAKITFKTLLRSNQFNENLL